MCPWRALYALSPHAPASLHPSAQVVRGRAANISLVVSLAYGLTRFYPSLGVMLVRVPPKTTQALMQAWPCSERETAALVLCGALLDVLEP